MSEAQVKQEKPKMICQKTLLSRPGWTKKAVEDFGLSCVLAPNMFGGAPVRRYSLTEVEAIEQTEEFINRKDRYKNCGQVLKERSPKEVAENQEKINKNKAEKLQALFDWVRNAEVVVERVENVHKEAFEVNGDYREAQGWKRESKNFAMQKGNIVLKHIMHHHSNYNDLMAKCHKCAKAGFMVFSRVLDRINVVYPEYEIFLNEHFLPAIEMREMRYFESQEIKIFTNKALVQEHVKAFLGTKDPHAKEAVLQLLLHSCSNFDDIMSACLYSKGLKRGSIDALKWFRRNVFLYINRSHPELKLFSKTYKKAFEKMYGITWYQDCDEDSVFCP